MVMVSGKDTISQNSIKNMGTVIGVVLIVSSAFIITLFVGVIIDTEQPEDTDIERINFSQSGLNTSHSETTIDNGRDLVTETNITVESVNVSGGRGTVSITHSYVEEVSSVDVSTYLDSGVRLADTTMADGRNQVTLLFDVNGTRENGYISTHVGDTRLSVHLDYFLTLETNQREQTFGIEELYAETQKASVSSKVRDHTNLSIATPINELLYVGPVEPQTSHLLIPNSSTSVKIVDASREYVSLDWISDVITTGEELIKGTEIESRNRSLTFVIGETTENAYLNGAAFKRSSKNSVLYVDSESAQPGETTVAHEWAHSLQKHKMTDEAYWWIEGSAEYLTYLVLKQMGELSQWEEEGFFHTGHHHMGKLRDPDTWDTNIQYDYGSEIAYLIDVVLRSQNQNITIINYIEEMNDQSTEFLQSDMIDLLNQYGATQIGDRLPYYVNQSGENVHMSSELQKYNIITEREYIPIHKEPNIPTTEMAMLNYKTYQCFSPVGSSLTVTSQVKLCD